MGGRCPPGQNERWKAHVSHVSRETWAVPQMTKAPHTHAYAGQRGSGETLGREANGSHDPLRRGI